MKRKRENYHKMTSLYVKQNWLLSKKNEFNDLIKFCESEENIDLVFSLLERFHYLTNQTYAQFLNDICDFIIDESGFSEENTQLLSLTYDEDADSGQKILDNLKVPIFQKGWRNVKTVNQFGKRVKNFKKGKNQIILIDEFIGSGKTLRGRLDYLKKNIPGNFEIICCFIAGTKTTIDDLLNEGINIFCPLQLEKGISEHFQDGDLLKMENLMLDLELKLSQNIKEKDLYEYSFGYGGAEALYTMEGCNGNTPNSVFPIFWWLKDIDNKERNTLLTRYEIGF